MLRVMSVRYVFLMSLSAMAMLRGVGLIAAFEPSHCLVGAGVLGEVGHGPIIPITHIRPDDDSPIIELESLHRMDAAAFVYRTIIDGIGRSIAQIPTDRPIADLDIVIVGVALGCRRPAPAVAGDQSCLSALVVLRANGLFHLSNIVENFDVVVDAFEIPAGSLAYVQCVVKPCKVSVGSVAAKLRIENVGIDLVIEELGPTLDLAGSSDVADGYLLALIDKEDGAAGRVDDLLNLVFSLVLI